MQWCLYEISQRPDVQEKLFAEVKSRVGESTVPGYEDLQYLPYMKAVIKETLRYILVHVQCLDHAGKAYVKPKKQKKKIKPPSQKERNGHPNVRKTKDKCILYTVLTMLGRSSM